jgi:hypothetical protein
MNIDNKTFKIEEINRYKTQIAKTQIILGTSLRKDNNHIIRLQNKDYHKTKRWNTYTISRNGSVYEHYSPKYHTDFLNIKEVDKKTISIILENMGCLFKTHTDKYINWLNEVCDEKDVIEKSWLGYLYWEKLTDEQLVSTVELCKYLCDEFCIPKVMIEFHHFHKDISKFKGIVFRSNYIEDCSDINPFFDIGNFNELLNNETN